MSERPPASLNLTNLRRLTVASAFYFTALGIGSPLVNLYLTELGASYAQISLILVIFVVTSIVTSALYGRYSARLGARRYWLVIGLAGQAAAYVLLAFTHALGVATMARVIEGIGMGLYTTVSLAVVGELLRDSPTKGRSMGIYRGIGSVAFAVGAVTGGLMADRVSVEAAFLVEASSFALAAIMAATLRPAPRPLPVLETPFQAVLAAEPANPARRVRSTLPIAFLVGVVLLMTAQSASTSMFPNYMSSLGRSFGAIGILWALAAALEMPAMFVSGQVSDRTGRPPVLAAGSTFIASVQFLYMATAMFPPLVFVAQLFRACGFGTFAGSSMTYTAEISTEEERGVNSGTYNIATLVGQLIGFAVGGTLVQILGFSMMYVVAGLIAVASALAFWQLHRARAAAR